MNILKWLNDKSAFKSTGPSAGPSCTEMDVPVLNQGPASGSTEPLLSNEKPAAFRR